MNKLIAILALTVVPLSSWSADFAVIVANDVNRSSLSIADVRSIFFGNKTTFNGGSAETCIWDSKTGEGLYQSALGVSKVQFSQQWVRKELTGAGRAPVSRENIEEVVACVSSSSHGIGLIPSSATDMLGGRVKVLQITE